MKPARLPVADPLDARKFLIAVRSLADSLSYGTDRSPFLGSGQEYVQSRPYMAGDPIKSIDWRVTARTGKFFVKEYESPKRMPVYLAVDTSASMVVSSHRHSKYATAVRIAGGLALACLDRISPVGVLSVGERGLRVQPSLSKDKILQWLHQLRHYSFDESTRMGQRLADLGSGLPNRSLIIVISDFHDAAALPVIRRLGRQHDCCVLHVRDPAERSLRGAGFFRGREAESGDTFVAHGRTRLTDPEALKADLRRGGIDYLLIDTDQPIAHRLRRFFADRGLLGKGAR